MSSFEKYEDKNYSIKSNRKANPIHQLVSNIMTEFKKNCYYNNQSIILSDKNNNKK